MVIVRQLIISEHSLHYIWCKPQPVMPKSFPITLLSSAQESFPLFPIIYSYFFKHASKFNEQTALLEYNHTWYTCVHITDIHIDMSYMMIVLLEYIDHYL